MPKKIDPRLIEILNTYGERAEDALWDCHGTWVAYHSAIERIAAKASIVFDMPMIVEASASSKIVSIAVRGVMGDKSEWSFGEASPSNNKNAYPYAMAEKRAKDRVTLKLIGLHGLVYSEEESDDFKDEPAAPVKSSAQLKRDNFWPEFTRELAECQTLVSLERFKAAWREKSKKDGWNKAFNETAKDQIEGRENAIRAKLDAASDAELSQMPVGETLRASIAPGENKYLDAMRAG